MFSLEAVVVERLGLFLEGLKRDFALRLVQKYRRNEGISRNQKLGLMRLVEVMSKINRNILQTLCLGLFDVGVEVHRGAIVHENVAQTSLWDSRQLTQNLVNRARQIEVLLAEESLIVDRDRHNFHLSFKSQELWVRGQQIIYHFVVCNGQRQFTFF